MHLYEHEVEVFHDGLLKANRQRMRYDTVAQVAVRSGILWSTVFIESTGGHRMRVDGLELGTARAAQTAIQEQMHLARGATAAAPQLDIPDQIRKLDELREAGILTDAEFAEKKQELLDRI